MSPSVKSVLFVLWIVSHSILVIKDFLTDISKVQLPQQLLLLLIVV